MDIIVILLPLAIVLGAVFAGLFVAAVRSGQFDDLDDPPQRILDEEAPWIPGPTVPADGAERTPR